MGKNKHPRKPSIPFGYLSFSKEGEVTKNITVMSDVKSSQEQEVMEIFKDQYNNLEEVIQISKIDQLPESNNDFRITAGDKKILVELTELAAWNYQIKITKEEYGSFSNPT